MPPEWSGKVDVVTGEIAAAGDLARLAGLPAPRSSPGWLAVPSAWALSGLWRLLRIRSRPPVTREALVFVAHDNLFPQRKAREVLGYRPRLGYEGGMHTVADYLASVNTRT